MVVGLSLCLKKWKFWGGGISCLREIPFVVGDGYFLELETLCMSTKNVTAHFLEDIY